MEELHALVDYENVQPGLEELSKLAPGFTDVWLFHGPHQDGQARQLAMAHDRVTLVPRSGKGKNALDFHLSFYLGYVAARHPDAHLVVVANDKGYDPMLLHATSLGFIVKRVAFEAERVPAVKKVAPAKAAASAKKAAQTAKPAPAKKTPAAKAPVFAKKAPAKKAAAKKAPVKKVPIAKASANSAAVKKSPAKAATPAKRAVQPSPAAVADPKEFIRVKKALAKMGNERPQKLKSFLRHVESMLGKHSTPAALAALIQKLVQENVVHMAGDVVSYR
jgi:hypothetical protein